MKILLLLLTLSLQTFYALKTHAEFFTMCPLCTISGELTCPAGYEVVCDDEIPFKSEPKCIFYGDRYVSGCLKFIEIKKLDLDFGSAFPGAKVDIIGGGETYTLNRETIGCRKL